MGSVGSLGAGWDLKASAGDEDIDRNVRMLENKTAKFYLRDRLES